MSGAGKNIERVVTHGTFELDGGSWEVDNNIWLVGDDSEVVVFDAAHDAAPIIDAVSGRHDSDPNRGPDRLLADARLEVARQGA